MEVWPQMIFRWIKIINTRIFPGHESGNSGGGMVETIITVGLVGIAATAFLYNEQFKSKETVKLNKSMDRAQLSNFLTNTVDCAETASQQDFASQCADNQTIDLYDAKRAKIVAKTGTVYSKYTVKAACNGSEITLSASEQGKPAENLNEGIPIACPARAQCIAGSFTLRRLTAPDCNASTPSASVRCALVADGDGSGAGGGVGGSRGNANLCEATIQKTSLSGAIDSVILNGVPVNGQWSGNTWTSDPYDCGAEATLVSAELSTAPVFRPPNDAADMPNSVCGEVSLPAVAPPAALTCKLRLVQGDLEYWTAAIERRPELVVKVTSDHNVQKMPKVLQRGSDPVTQGAWSQSTTAFKGCSDPPCFRGQFSGQDVWMPGYYEVEIEDVNGTKGTCKAYNYSCWDTSWRGGRQAYWKGGPLVKDFARNLGVLNNPPGGPATGTVAYDSTTMQKLCEWTGLKVMFSSTKSSENRDNYTSCGDDRHLKWDGSKIISVKACTSNWVGCLLCN